MQDRYSGDIGDFSKFLLLKELFYDEEILIIWFLREDEKHNNDGRHIKYLDSKLCDEDIANVLRRVVLKNRSVKFMQKEIIKVLPKLNFFDIYMEELSRDEYINRAKSSLKNFKVAFVAPDNGIEIKSVSKSSKFAKKYIFFDEINIFFNELELLIVYQHFPRVNHCKYLRTRAKEIKERIRGDFYLYAIKFKKVSLRAYFILIKEAYLKKFQSSLENFKKSKCYENYEIYIF